jgi:hypothetical protein
MTGTVLEKGLRGADAQSLTKRLELLTPNDYDELNDVAARLQ